MVNQNSIFGGMLTSLGAAKKTNCDALGIPWEPSYMLIGDANDTDPVPSPGQTQLIRQVYRAPLNALYVSPTDDKVLIAELVLPPEVGGWWIRELAIEDKDGVFCAVANVAPSYKPLLAQGSGRNQVVRMHIITSGTSNIQLKIDPSVVLATRQYVDSSLRAALPENKVSGTYRQVTIDKRGIVVSGSNPTTLAGYAIVDAYTKLETSVAIQTAVVGKADKASTLDGYGITDGMPKGTGGIGTSVVTYVADLNAIQSTGMFRFGGETANRPAGAVFGTVSHISYDQASGNWTQHAVGTSPRRSWIRSRINGALQSWVEVWDAESFNPASKADASAVAQASEAARGTVMLAGFADVNTGDGFKAMTANMFMNFSLGFRQVWRDMLGSRAAGVGYLNSTGKPIIVSVISSTADRGLYIHVDGVVVSKQGQEGGTGSDFNCVQAIIPPGSTYAVGLLGGATISHWAELRT